MPSEISNHLDVGQIASLSVAAGSVERRIEVACGLANEEALVNSLSLSMDSDKVHALKAICREELGFDPVFLDSIEFYSTDEFFVTSFGKRLFVPLDCHEDLLVSLVCQELVIMQNNYAKKYAWVRLPWVSLSLVLYESIRYALNNDGYIALKDLSWSNKIKKAGLSLVGTGVATFVGISLELMLSLPFMYLVDTEVIQRVKNPVYLKAMGDHIRAMLAQNTIKHSYGHSRYKRFYCAAKALEENNR